jgi:hypothetical protein
MLGPMKRKVTLSRSILPTIASTARGRWFGGRKYRRPFVPSSKGLGTWVFSGHKPPSGSFTQLSRDPNRAVADPLFRACERPSGTWQSSASRSPYRASMMAEQSQGSCQASRELCRGLTRGRC